METAQRIEELLTQLRAKDEENTTLQEENTRLAQELLYYKRLYYGRRSEKRMPFQPEGQLFLCFEGETRLPEETPELHPIIEEIEIESHKRRKNRIKNNPKREEIPLDIERRQRTLEPEGVDLAKVEKIGEDVREILHYTPGSFYVDRIVRPIYKIKQPVNNLSTPIYQAEAVETFIPRSIAGASLLCHILISKYVDHLPEYRQLEIFKRHGIKLAASTVNGWIHQTATQLYPLYQCLVKNVLSCGYIQMDETTLPVVNHQKKKTDKEYVWTVLDVLNRQTFFYYDKGSRSQKTLLSILLDYQGALQSDGYEAYRIYEDKKGVLLLGCWAHARRKFEAALAENKELAGKALDYIGLLYQIEANLKEKKLGYEEMATQRKRLAYPILLDFEQWMLDTAEETLPKSLMGKAISYTFSIYPRLVRYVSDGRYCIDNNPVENVIRPLALGRKNYLFCDSHDTARNTILFYSFFGSCKLAGINPYEWLTDVLERIKDCKVSDIEKFLPRYWKIHNP
jgi:Transposase and inactivated derivatives